MQNRYFVVLEGQQKGPFTQSELIQKVKDNEFSVMDYYYDEEHKDWLVLMNLPQVAGYLDKRKSHEKKAKSNNHMRPLKNEATVVPLNWENIEELNKVQWFVLKGDNKFGPYKYKDLVAMLQNKTLFEYDYVWFESLSGWKRVAQLECFQPEAIKKIQQEGNFEFIKAFFRRRHRRARFQGSIIVHDNKRVWKGSALEISAGGAGLVMENALLMPGQSVFIHMIPGEGLPPFNAICEVVNKEYVQSEQDPSTPIRYGVKFTNLTGEAQEFIKSYTSKVKSAA